MRIRRELATTKGTSLFKVLDIDPSWSLGWSVASESSVGGVFARANDVPVVRTGHLIRKILINRGLRNIGQWLKSQAYLPIEKEHYQVIEQVPTVAGYTIKWSGIKILTNGIYV